MWVKTLHTDQVVYPFLFMVSILMAAIAAKKHNLGLALCAGVFIYLSIWFTFSLVFVFPFVIVSCFFLTFQNNINLDSPRIRRSFQPKYEEKHLFLGWKG